MGKESSGEELGCRVVVVVASFRNEQEGLPEKGQLSQGLKEAREAGSHVDIGGKPCWEEGTASTKSLRQDRAWGPCGCRRVRHGRDED